MDDIVRQAMAKWPNVPHCYGWLGLDARGQWWMRDDRAQAEGPFPRSKGSLLRHEKLVDFIQRNYDRDADGCWYFQNGPQRVYVELEAAPLVWRVSQAGELVSHHGHPARAQKALVDEEGRLFVAADLGLGLVHTLDVEWAADAIERGTWPLEEVKAASLPARYGFVLQPSALAMKKAG